MRSGMRVRESKVGKNISLSLSFRDAASGDNIQGH